MTSTFLADGMLLVARGRRQRTRVLVVDDHLTFAELLSRALGAEPDLDCVGHVHASHEVLPAVERLRPDVVLMDMQLPDGDGIDATAELVRRRPGVEVFVLTAHATVADIDRAEAAGARGFLTKDGSLDEVLDVLRAPRGEALLVPDGLVDRLTPPATSEGADGIWPLTPRELEVLRLLGLGLDSRAIAKELGVSLNTCRDHVKRVLGKLGVHSQLEAVVVGTRLGLIRLDP